MTFSSKGQVKAPGGKNAGWEAHTGQAQAKKAGAGLVGGQSTKGPATSTHSRAAQRKHQHTLVKRSFLCRTLTQSILRVTVKSASTDAEDKD